MSNRNKELEDKLKHMGLGDLAEYKKVAQISKTVISVLAVSLLLVCLNFPTMLIVVVTSIFTVVFAVVSEEIDYSLSLIQDRIDELDK